MKEVAATGSSSRAEIPSRQISKKNACFDELVDIEKANALLKQENLKLEEQKLKLEIQILEQKLNIEKTPDMDTEGPVYFNL